MGSESLIPKAGQEKILASRILQMKSLGLHVIAFLFIKFLFPPINSLWIMTCSETMDENLPLGWTESFW